MIRPQPAGLKTEKRKAQSARPGGRPATGELRPARGEARRAALEQEQGESRAALIRPSCVRACELRER